MGSIPKSYDAEPMQTTGWSVAPKDTRLFAPLKVGNMDLKHRMAMAPLTRYRNDDSHVPMPFMAQYYSDRACEPGTLIISEATAINHTEEGQPSLPGLITDAQVEGWRQVVDAVHAKGSFFFQQIWGVGRAASPEYQAQRGLKYHSSGNAPVAGSTTAPEAMTEEEIEQTIEDFVATAKRVMATGADGIEIHSAHGYLLDQFLTAEINNRTDKWGGSLENRARLTLTVIKAVSDAIGAEKVAVRLSPYAGFQGSAKPESEIHSLYLYILSQIKAMGLKLAYLSLVEATGDPGTMLLDDKPINQGRTLDVFLESWDNWSPVMVAGGYKPLSAAYAVEKHYAKWDVLVAFGRYWLATPDFVYRVRHGIELTKWDRPTFYVPKANEGYNTYPFSEQYLKEQEQAKVA